MKLGESVRVLSLDRDLDLPRDDVLSHDDLPVPNVLQRLALDRDQEAVPSRVSMLLIVQAHRSIRSSRGICVERRQSVRSLSFTLHPDAVRDRASWPEPASGRVTQQLRGAYWLTALPRLANRDRCENWRRGKPM